ncbi:IS110 family transposase [Weissella muntiaci]|uniref:IS110 family transposase n=1 Tax=Weissella muntiaci TaxID=2508881 RepID=A0A6C2CC34_9LACO|nr:MobP2 family relaxase [Weissella muntiaci]TYC51089.1 IS110 family transposase [Weissella muntiaci]
MKTGSIAKFKMGEVRKGAILLPTHFTTASKAKESKQRYKSIVRKYGEKAGKVNESNNFAISDIKADDVFSRGYAQRETAVTEEHPIFDSGSLNLNDDQVERLENRLDQAQDNGNILHEMAFSIRGDWLAENDLYDPKTETLDQNSLKRAEQKVVSKLFDKAFPLPLGEGQDDVVWFGVIHQDTDHLNMHLWFSKVSEETRPEMLHKSGEPIGIMNFKVKKQVEAKFRYELSNEATTVENAKIYEAVGKYQSSIKNESLNLLDNTNKYTADLQEIYEVLPENMRGRWKVGNTNNLKTSEDSPMYLANQRMTKLIDKLLNDDMNDEFKSFVETTLKMDQKKEYVYGSQNKGQQSWSQGRYDRLQKEMANSIYRQFNENFKDPERLDRRTVQAKDFSNEPVNFNKSAVDKGFAKDRFGNFENIRGKGEAKTQNKMPVEKTTFTKLNSISKKLNQLTKAEVDHMHKMLNADKNAVSKEHDISDESLGRNL